MSDIWVAFEDPLPTIDDPVRTGYTFMGWYEDIFLTVPFTTTEMPLYGLTLYADWVINQYTISFAENGGSVVEDITQDYASAVSEPDEPTRTGYTFAGWYADSDLGTPYVFTVIPAEDITVYAKWIINEYEISYYEVETGTIYAGGGNGFSFVIEADGSVYAFGRNDYGQLGDGTLTERWSAVNITDKFTLDPGERIIVIKGGYNHSIALSNHGNVFTFGSNAYGQLGKCALDYSSLPMDITSRLSLNPGETIVAVAANTYYSIALSSDGNLYAWGYNQYGQFGIGTTGIADCIPQIISGYLLLEEGEDIIAFAAGDNHLVVLTSMNRVLSSGQNLYGQLGNNSTTDSDSFVDISAAIALEPEDNLAGVSAGSRFSLVYTESGRVFVWGANDHSQLGTGESTSVSHLTPYEITANFNLQSGETFIKILTDYHSAHALTTNQRFFVWGYDGNCCLGLGDCINQPLPTLNEPDYILEDNEYIVGIGRNREVIYVITSHGRVYSAGRELHGSLGYEVEGDFAPDFGLIPGLGTFLPTDSTSIVFNSVLDLPEPEREGHTFLGWYSDSLFLVPFTEVTMPAYDFNLYARWEINQYTISFTENGGSDVDDITQDYGTLVTEPTSPTRTAFTFIGWYADEELTIPYTFSTMPAENITLYAKWTDIPYTISFVENGGSEVEDIVANYGESVSEPAEPTRTGYTFIDWYADSELTTVYVFTTMPLGGRTVYAKWEINEYTLKFIKNVEYLDPQFADGVSHSLLLTTDGRLYAVGSNAYGQLGDGTLVAKTTKIDITGLLGLGETETISKIAVANASSYVLTSTGRLLVAGYNNSGQLGTGDKTNRSSFTDITENFTLDSGETITDIACGGETAFVTTSAGRIFGFGSNAYGSVGDGTSGTDRTLPVDITGNFSLGSGETITALQIGVQHAYALTSADRLFSWGRNDYGQVGIGTTVNQLLPVDITANFPLDTEDEIVMVAAGFYHGYALSEAGRVFSWGYNYYGMLGINYGGSGSNRSLPTEITNAFYLESDDKIIYVTASEYNGQAISSSGRIYSWGYGSYSVNANGLTTVQYAPYEITANFKLFNGESLLSISGYGHSMHAITSMGRVIVWGYGTSGMRFDGITDRKSVV